MKIKLQYFLAALLFTSNVFAMDAPPAFREEVEIFRAFVQEKNREKAAGGMDFAVWKEVATLDSAGIIRVLFHERKYYSLLLVAASLGVCQRHILNLLFNPNIVIGGNSTLLEKLNFIRDHEGRNLLQVAQEHCRIPDNQRIAPEIQLPMFVREVLSGADAIGVGDEVRALL